MYEWVDLMAPDPGLDPGRVGAAVAAIHRIPAPAAGPLDPWYCEPVGAGRWDELVGQLRGAGAPFAGRLADLRDELVALESWIEPPQLLQTCHRDLWADNVLPTAGGGICVIDWENSGPADPSQELGCVLFEFGRDDPGRARALTDAYRQAGGRQRCAGAGTSRCSSPSSGTSPRPPQATGWPPAPARRSEPTPPPGSARFSPSRTPASCSAPS